MLVRESNNKKIGHIEFVSYTGEYPNLCRGVLTLKIDGVKKTFGFDYYNRDTKPDYPEFWSSGGDCGFTNDFAESYVNHGDWYIYESRIPSEYREYAAEIDEVFNANVPKGCCGGCL